jgi:hypothetical protein
VIFKIILIQNFLLYGVALYILKLYFSKKDFLLSRGGKNLLRNKFGNLRKGVALTITSIFIFFLLEGFEFAEEFMGASLEISPVLLDYITVFYLTMYLIGLLYFLSILIEVEGEK